MTLRDLRFGLLLYVANHVVARVPSHRLRLAFYRRVMRFEIGPGSAVFLGAWVDARGRMRIGADTVVNQRCRLDSRGGLTIGDHVSVSAEACLLTADHDVRSASFAGRDRPVVIGDYAFIGTRAMVLPGVTVGEGAVVAAGAVVTRDVAAYTIVAGVPARPVGERPRGLDYTVDYVRPLF